MTNDCLRVWELKQKLNDRFFLYEVVLSSPRYRQSHFRLKVPYRLMKQQMQRITRQGGQILKISPYNAHSNLPWWIEIETREPNCLYYFGPFDEIDEARSSESGYIEDLKSEGAQDIKVQMKRCNPSILTQER